MFRLVLIKVSITVSVKVSVSVSVKVSFIVSYQAKTLPHYPSHIDCRMHSQ